MNVPNHRGDTPLSLLQAYLGAPWISLKVTERIKDVIGSSRRSIFSRLIKDKVLSMIAWLLLLLKSSIFLENTLVVYGRNTISGLLLRRSNFRH